jgi:hypothetical protein
MKTISPGKTRAVEALRTVLEHVSAIKLKEIILDSMGPDSKIDILAEVEVYGHRHSLACKVIPGDDFKPVSESLSEFREHAARMCANATPILIAPQLSPEFRSLCRELQTGFLDLEGNARLEIGEVFIARQHLPVREGQLLKKPVASALDRPSSHRKLTPIRADILSPDRAVVVASA